MANGLSLDWKAFSTCCDFLYKYLFLFFSCTFVFKYLCYSCPTQTPPTRKYSTVLITSGAWKSTAHSWWRTSLSQAASYHTFIPLNNLLQWELTRWTWGYGNCWGFAEKSPARIQLMIACLPFLAEIKGHRYVFFQLHKMIHGCEGW